MSPTDLDLIFTDTGDKAFDGRFDGLEDYFRRSIGSGLIEIKVCEFFDRIQ